MYLTCVGKVLGVGHPGSLALKGDLILTVFASTTLKSLLSHYVRDHSSLFPVKLAPISLRQNNDSRKRHSHNCLRKANSCS